LPTSLSPQADPRIYGADERVRVQRACGSVSPGRRDQRPLRAGLPRGLPRRRPAGRSGLPPPRRILLPAPRRLQRRATGVWQFMQHGPQLHACRSAVDERLTLWFGQGRSPLPGRGLQRLEPALAITSYNHGVGGMARAKAEHGSDFGRIVRQYQGPAFKFASRNYYAEFLAAREIANHPDTYFPGIVRQAPLTEDRIVLHTSMPATHVASHYGVVPRPLASVTSPGGAGAQRPRPLPAGHTVWLPRARPGASLACRPPHPSAHRHLRGPIETCRPQRTGRRIQRRLAAPGASHAERR